MNSYDMSRLLLLLFLCVWDSAHGLCLLKKQNAAECDDLEDARYIDTYHLHSLRASSSEKTLTPGNFKNLTSLRHLDLSNGNTETIETGSFAKLGSLATLNLANNRIAHLEAGAFDGLKHLRNLKLSGNKIRQLPSALMTLKELRFLDVFDNPLNCNCASMKLRDALLIHGVKMSKRTRCVEPISSKGISLLKPNANVTCEFETQDMEMQGDQPLNDRTRNSRDEDDGLVNSDFEVEVKEIKQSDEKPEEETPAPPAELPESSSITMADLTPQPELEEAEKEMPVPPVSSKGSSTTTVVLTTSGEVASTEGVTSSMIGNKDDITFEDTEDSSKKDLVTEIAPEENEEVNLDTVEAEKKDSSTQDLSLRDNVESSGDTDDEGSGEIDDDGSGEVSSMISPVNVPEIDFHDRLDTEQEGAEDSSSVTPTTSATPTTTADNGWWDVWSVINPFGSGGTTTTTQASTTTEKNPEEQVREEEFILTVTEPPKNIDEQPIIPRIIGQNESSKNIDQPAPGNNPSNGEPVVNSVNPATSQESQKGSGSYYVLATLLAILAILIAFAAYKGDFCKKKRKHGDVERGTEMKDMQKSLLEQNTVPPKTQVSNGNTMENVPLMNSASIPEEPKENQKSYDITPAITNGSSRPVGLTQDAIDPVKPPRKGYGEIEAPLNGLNPPMDDIDGPTTLQNESDDVLPNGHYNSEDPSLSPGAQRVKITMGELPESVPKTPILITRLKNGENLVKTP